MSSEDGGANHGGGCVATCGIDERCNEASMEETSVLTCLSEGLGSTAHYGSVYLNS